MGLKSRDLIIAAGAIGLITVALPVADSLTSLIQTGLNYVTNSISIHNAFNTHNAEQLMAEDEAEHSCGATQAIGFQYEQEPEYDECEDDLNHKLTRKIGF